MSIALGRWVACLLLVGAALLLLSFDAAAEPSTAAPPRSMLAPSNPVFDLKDHGLKTLWTAELGRVSEPRLKTLYPVAETLVAETPSGEVHVLNAADGTWQNMQMFSRGLECSPVAVGDRMLVVSASRLFSFDPATEQVGEGHHLAFAPFCPPLLKGDSLILAGGNGHLARLSRPGYRQLWQRSIRGPIWHQPAMLDGNLYASASEVICLEPEDGTELWRWEPREPSRLSSGIALHHGRVYAGDNLGNLYALGAGYGDLKWQQSFGAPIVGKPEVVGDKLLVFTNDPKVHCLSLNGERAVLWSYDGATDLIVAGANRVYLRTEDDGVAAVLTDRGEELWKDRLPAGCLVAGDPNRPVFYVGNSEGTIAAFQELD